ncbi:Inositol 2-dehydrogenase/D-chiro-inositol 3-dehydrogenase [bioreactor metagenome]|jgi:predicted dehydrogenase|uniref:Inositol 2-dehydrogenase/D-chiro-inositol 3-dehydrogenase n=1 Tax=bioreactor metagenome TaxID=1076179 RepID=A0A644V838_9ZZZZ|nr:Gfo/Idh/MocA family oxidoreductase [Lentimicrobium sp.]MEA5112352.1 Gfo/Idh/MocA family oxidoreductase [Lentimicrobium sp.]
MLKIGVLGAGHLGKIHLKCIKQTDSYELVGFYDADAENARMVETDLSVKSYSSIDELIDQVDVVDIVTPTLSHFDCASKALKKFRHVFIEKPVVTTPEEARLLVDLAEEAGVKVQVGHVERFNPAFIAATPYIDNPMFIETHRLAQFNPRGTDVPVILDLMIHDLDIVLSIVKANIRKVSASGVAVVSDTPDIANARIEFDNGCVANLTASRISMKNMRKSRFFQRDAYIAVDFLDKKTEIIRMRGVDPATADPMAMILDLGPGKLPKQILFDQPEVKPLNAIQTELESFADAINNNTPPPVTINDGYAALELAYRIIGKMNSAANLI